MRHARSHCSPRPSHYDRFPARPSRWATFCGCRVHSHETSTPDRDSRRRSPNLRVSDRLIAGFCSMWVKPTRLLQTAIALKPSTVLQFHRALVQRKYRLLFSSKRGAKPGPQGPSPDVIRAVVDMKQRNPTWGCPRIAEQITLAVGILINKDVVRRKRIPSAVGMPSAICGTAMRSPARGRGHWRGCRIRCHLGKLACS